MADILDLAKLRELANAERPIFEHEIPGVGVVKFHAVNGVELENAVFNAKGDDAKYRQFLVNAASVEPKITNEMWLLLGKLAPTARGGLVAAVLRKSGLGAEAHTDATKSAAE